MTDDDKHRALDPAIAEQAKEVQKDLKLFRAVWGELPSVAPHIATAPGVTTGSVISACDRAASLITALLTANAALRAERDALATANYRQAACIHATAANLGPDYSATVDGLPKAARHVSAEGDALRGAVQGLVEVLDQNEMKGPLPDTALMLCWLAAQNVRAVLRGIMLEKPE